MNTEEIVTMHLETWFSKIGMDRPSNMDELVSFMVEDIKETADEEFSSGDVAIAFRRFLERGS